MANSATISESVWRPPGSGWLYRFSARPFGPFTFRVLDGLPFSEVFEGNLLDCLHVEEHVATVGLDKTKSAVRDESGNGSNWHDVVVPKIP